MMICVGLIYPWTQFSENDKPENTTSPWLSIIHGKDCARGHGRRSFKQAQTWTRATWLIQKRTCTWPMLGAADKLSVLETSASYRSGMEPCLLAFSLDLFPLDTGAAWIWDLSDLFIFIDWTTTVLISCVIKQHMSHQEWPSPYRTTIYTLSPSLYFSELEIGSDKTTKWSQFWVPFLRKSNNWLFVAWCVYCILMGDYLCREYSSSVQLRLTLVLLSH